MKRNHGLDLLRALAILMVLFLHALHAAPESPEILRSLFEPGWAGVDLFFVLSGFLIGGQVFSEDFSKSKIYLLKTFWIKRWYRTFPLYYTVLAFYVLLKPLMGFPFRGWNWGYLFFFQNYTGLKDFTHTWSLSIEEQFYLVFPLLVFILGIQKKWKVIWILPLLISFLSRYFLWASGEISTYGIREMAEQIHFPTHTHLDGISIGVLLAAYFSVWSKWSVGVKRILLLLGTFLVGISLFQAGETIHGFSSIYTFTAIAIGFGMMLIGVYDVRIHSKLFAVIHKIALWSYGLYLWNNIFIGLINKLSLDIHWGFKWIIYFMLSFVMAIITYYLIEKPGLKYRNKVLTKLSN